MTVGDLVSHFNTEVYLVILDKNDGTEFHIDAWNEAFPSWNYVHLYDWTIEMDGLGVCYINILDWGYRAK